MLPPSEDLATKADMLHVRTELTGEIAALRTEMKGELASLRTEMKGEIAGMRSEIAGMRSEIGMLRVEMTSRFATKDDLLASVNGFNETMSGHVRTFIVVQAATVVGMSGILFGLLRLT